MTPRGALILLIAMCLASACAGSCAAADDLPLLTTFRQEFVAVTPGQGAFAAEFDMGSADDEPSARPVHRVRLKAPFAIARYEVPQNLWQAVMLANPSRWKGPRNAVEMLSYDDAVEFCRQVTDRLRQAGLITAEQVVRLPTEAEWEYVARAGTRSRYSFGDDEKDLDEHAWSTRNAAGNDPPVGAKRPNPWQVHDMHGYLWEWCADAWHDSYQGAPTDGSAWLDGAAKLGVLRGGSWKDPAERLTSSFRRSAPRELKDDAVGLRCVLSDREGK